MFIQIYLFKIMTKKDIFDYFKMLEISYTVFIISVRFLPLKFYKTNFFYSFNNFEKIFYFNFL